MMVENQNMKRVARNITFSMNIRICMSLDVFLVAVLGNPISSFEPVCRLRPPPNVASRRLSTTEMVYPGRPQIPCGKVYNSQQNCICPGSLVCYDPETANLWSPNGTTPMGLCIGEDCDELAWWPREQQKRCRGAQSCVHRGKSTTAKPLYNTGPSEGAKGGRCLPNHPKSRCGWGAEQSRDCPKAWECIQDIFSTPGLGYCSPLGANWWPSQESFTTPKGNKESDSPW
jgi:hypothetical protein